MAKQATTTNKSSATITTPRQVIGSIPGGTPAFVGGVSVAKESAAGKQAQKDIASGNYGPAAKQFSQATVQDLQASIPQNQPVTPSVVTPPAITPAAVSVPNAVQAVSVEAPKVIEAGGIMGEAIMAGDVRNIANQINRNYIAAQRALQMPGAEIRAMERRNQLASELRGLQTEQVLRETGIREAPSEVGQAIVGRQINALNRYIATRQLPLVNEIQAQTDIISTYQEQRNQILKQLEISMDQGKFNLGLAREYENRKYQEQKEVQKLAQTLGVSGRYLEINGEVKDTVTGEGLSLAEFQRRTGQQIGAPESATDFSMVQSYQSAFNAATQKEILTDFITKYPEARISPTDSLEAAQNKIARVKQKAGQGGAGAGVGPASPVVQAYTDAVLAGTLDITNVPANQRNGVILEMQRRAQSGAQGTVAVTDPRQAEIRFAYYAQQLPQLIAKGGAIDDPFAQAEQLKVELPTVDPKKIDAMVYTSYGVPESVWQVKEPRAEQGERAPLFTAGGINIAEGISRFFR